MKVLLLSSNTEKVNVVPLPLGLICVAQAVQKAGHEVEFVDLMAAQGERPTLLSLRRAVRDYCPQAIGISVRNIDNQDMSNPVFFLDSVRQVVAECRENSDAPIILGGAGYSIFPQGALDYLGADMGIRGEGEAALPALLDHIRKDGKVPGLPGLYVRGRHFSGNRETFSDINKLPLPDPQLAARFTPEPAETWMPFQTRRGCPLACSYCSTPLIEGCRMRKRDPDSVIESLAGYLEAGFKKFWFVDNTFNLPLPYAKEICRRIIGSGLKTEWRAILYPGVMDRELAGLLAKAGCIEAALGFESGSGPLLRRMNKKFNPRDVERCSEMLRTEGIGRVGFLLLGGPGETRETVRESLRFADSLKLDSVKVTSGIRIYPHTALAKAAVVDGLVSPADDLLLPRFYMVPGLGEWLADTLREWTAERPEWVC